MRNRTIKGNKVKEIREKCEGRNEGMRKKTGKQRKTVTNPARDS